MPYHQHPEHGASLIEAIAALAIVLMVSGFSFQLINAAISRQAQENEFQEIFAHTNQSALQQSGNILTSDIPVKVTVTSATGSSVIGAHLQEYTLPGDTSEAWFHARS